MSAVDPYLPNPIPTDNVTAQSKASGAQTLIVWVAFIVLFVVAYNLFASTKPAPQREMHDAGFSLYSLIPWTVLAAFVAWLYVKFRGASELHTKQNPALLAAADGDLEGARTIYASLLAEYGKTAQAPTMQLNLANVLERMGRFDECRDLLLSVERAPGVYASSNRVLASTQLARVLTLSGDLPRAAKWLVDAQKRRAKNPAPSLYIVGEQRVIEAMLLCRQGEPEKALAILEADWHRIEYGMTASHLKPVVLLRAYLTSVVGGVRGEGNATPWLAQLRTTRPQDLAFVMQAWPELASWYAAQGLARAA